MKDFLLHHCSGICIRDTGGAGDRRPVFAGQRCPRDRLLILLLAAFIAVIVSINLSSLHQYLKRRHKGGCSL
ncbi:MAG: hypothetical protein V8T10_02645 [Merdibacter sp.]